MIPSPDHYRHAWIRAKLKTLKGSLLDVGCGPQPYREDCAHLDYKAQDFAQYTGTGTEGLHDEAWKYGKLDYTGNAWDIKERSKTFDNVLCSEVLEHVPFARDTMVEIGRLLKQGGTAIVTAPVNCLPHQNPYFFSHGYSKEFYLEAAAAASMEVVSFETYSGAIDFLLLESYRILRAGSLFMGLIVAPLLLAKLLRLKGPDYPCFGALVVLRRI